MSADPERISGILDELIRQRRRFESAGDRRILEANGRAIAYWQSQRAEARRVAARKAGYTDRRPRM